MLRKDILTPNSYTSMPLGILLNPLIGSNAKIIYTFQLYRLNENEETWWKEADIAKALGIGVSTVQRGTQELEQFGWVYVKRQKRKGNRYTLLRPATEGAQTFERSDNSSGTASPAAQGFEHPVNQANLTGQNERLQSVKMNDCESVKMTYQSNKGKTNKKESKKPLAASPLAVAAAPAWVPAPRVHLESGDANALEASPAHKDGTQVADAVNVIEPAPALPLPVVRIPELVATPVRLAALHPDSIAFLAGVIAEQEAKAGTAATVDDEHDSEADAGDEFEDLNEWAGEVAADWEEEQDEVEANVVAA